jgi:hypothetical protein
VRQVRALAMFGQQGDGDELSTNAFSVREAKMLEALRRQVVRSEKSVLGVACDTSYSLTRSLTTHPL